MNQKRKRFGLIKRLSALVGVLILLLAGVILLFAKVSSMVIITIIAGLTCITAPALFEGGGVLEVFTAVFEIVADAIMWIAEALASVFNL